MSPRIPATILTPGTQATTVMGEPPVALPGEQTLQIRTVVPAAPDAGVRARATQGSGLVSRAPRAVSPYQDMSARDAIGAKAVRDLVVAVSPVGAAAKKGAYKVAAPQYVKDVMAAKDIYDLMVILERLNPEIRFYIGDVEGTPESVKEDDFDKQVRACLQKLAAIKSSDLIGTIETTVATCISELDALAGPTDTASSEIDEARNGLVRTCSEKLKEIIGPESLATIETSINTCIDLLETAFAKRIPFPSEQVYGLKPIRAIEYNKLAVTFWTIVSLLNRNFDFLKKSAGPLDDKTLEEFRANFVAMLGPDPDKVLEFNPEKFRAFMQHMTIHDIGKVAAFKLASEGLVDALAANHDEILAQAMQDGLDFLVPPYELLTDESRALVEKALKAAGNMNIPQIFQGEAGPAMLANMTGLSEEQAEFFIYHVMFDTYGSKGFVAIGPTLLAGFLHPVFMKSIPHVKASASGEAGFDPFAAYEAMLKSTIGPTADSLDFSDPTQLTLARFYGGMAVRLSEFATIKMPERATIIKDMLDKLDAADRQTIIDGYSANGITDNRFSRTMQYAPSLIENAARYYLSELEANLTQTEKDALRKQNENIAFKLALEDCLPVIAKILSAVESQVSSKTVQQGSLLINLQAVANMLTKQPKPDGTTGYAAKPSELKDYAVKLGVTPDGMNVSLVKAAPSTPGVA